MLRSAGYEVVTAENSFAALRVLESAVPILLVITDVVMKHGVDGFTLGRMVSMRHPEMKVIFVTAHDIEASPAVGCIVRKPVDFAVLLESIRFELRESR